MQHLQASPAIRSLTAGSVWARALTAAVACMLLLGLLSLVNLAAFESGPRAGHAIQVDELFFSACAVRGLQAGHNPVAGCHDNKGPVIFLVHRLAQPMAGAYDMLAVKRVALGTVALIVVLAAWLAHRVAGRGAGMAAAALVSLTFAVDAENLALKTETVGMVFILLGMVAVTGPPTPRIRWWLCGLWVGLAVLSKQTFGFAVLAFVAWLWLSDEQRRLPGSAKRFATRSTLFAAGLALPFAAFSLLFLWQGLLPDFLASLFLYPSVYGAPSSFSPVHQLAWRLGDVVGDLLLLPLVVGLFCAVVPLTLLLPSPGTDKQRAAGDANALVVLTALALLLVVLVAPVYFRFHLLPAWLLMATASGIALAQSAQSPLRADRRLAVAAATTLVSMALLMALTSWYTNGRKGRQLPTDVSMAKVDVRPGSYAYVLGMWPQFYVHNGLVPASDIQFPWALPGTPPTWAYTPPPEGSLRARALASMHARNLARLFEDFRATPPSTIVVTDMYARAKDSPQVADVPGFDDYLRQHCVHAGALPERSGSSQRLYRCGAAGGDK